MTVGENVPLLSIPLHMEVFYVILEWVGEGRDVCKMFCRTGIWLASDVTPRLYLCYMHSIPDIIFSLCVPPARLPASYRTLSDLATISIFSSYVPLCDTSLTFLFMYRYSHAYVSLCLDSPMTPLHCYAHAPLSFAPIDSISFATSSLPYCASTYAFPATDVYFYDAYDVFFP